MAAPLYHGALQHLDLYYMAMSDGPHGAMAVLMHEGRDFAGHGATITDAIMQAVQHWQTGLAPEVGMVGEPLAQPTTV